MRSARSRSALALIPAALAGAFALAYTNISAHGPSAVSLPWVPALNLSLAFQLDGLSAFFAIVISAMGALVLLYSSAYLDGHPNAGRFQVLMLAFMTAMLGLVLSDNLYLLFVFWELTGFTSYLLIGFDHDRDDARRAAAQAFIVTGAGGLALLAAAILVTMTVGTASISQLIASGSIAHRPFYTAIVVLVFLAAFTKSAQFPFHFWLPNAMQAPTPASAYLHSATMVKAGVYLVARMTPVLGGTPLWTNVIVAVAALTLIGSAYRSLIETDLKRILAYSTIGALAVLMLLFGIGSPHAVTAGLVFLVAHACYKGALFLVAGSIEHEAGTRDVTRLGGLAKAMPRTALAARLAGASMAGVPLFLGFIAKDLVYDSLVTFDAASMWRALLIVAAVGGSACLGAAGLLAGFAPFAGERAPSPAHHDVPMTLWFSPLILGALGVALGLAPMLANGPVALAAGSVLRVPVPVALAIWHGVSAPIALSAVTLIGSAALFLARDAVRRHAWPRALSTARIYDGAIDGLDALSRRIAPALQNASLRSYVLTVVVAAVTLVGVALATGKVLPEPRRWTPVEFHEGVIAALIIASALSAAFARSIMAAVLSLGAVGYGVALLYALFGAPDLAITQFAVETLTVVIFVVVFPQLGGFGDLSSRFVKGRDIVVASAAGALVTTLVLFVGSSGTFSRLALYFDEMAPTLAHGRNVVNVILVDFRGFDTLGETTVLVTVAIGVRALLLIGRERS